MSLVLDLLKQGVGNSNDRNIGKNLFNNSTMGSEITGLYGNLFNIFGTKSSCHYLNLATNKTRCLVTAKVCQQNYGWYKMSVSVHKLLIHSSDILTPLPLPVGELSEDG